MAPERPEKHHDDILNIATGEHGTSRVNVHDAVQKGVELMNTFSQKLPGGLNDTIHKTVVTMVALKKHVKVGDTKVYDMNVIYSRVIGLQASGRDIDIRDVLSHELAPMPTSMFDTAGEMRPATSKSSLKRQLQVEVSARTSPSDKSNFVIDGSALLWVIPWPANGTIKDYAMNLKSTLSKLLNKGDVHLVFDRYYDYSTKSVTRSARVTGACRVHQMQVNSTLPPQKTVLTVSENKKQLIGHLVNLMVDGDLIHECTKSHRLIVVGEEAAPFEISNGVVIRRTDMAIAHEEADNIIVQQVMMCAQSDEQSAITVISDDTDVFVLLVHYYQTEHMKNHVTMESPIKERTVTDIGKTVEKHAGLVTDILASHALTGCDTVACYYGIGKGTALKVLRAGQHSLSLLGCIESPIESVIAQATSFMSACYGVHSCKSMSEARWRVWASKTGHASSPPKLCSLPPTNGAFAENVKRAHHQAIVWRSLQQLSPPEMDPELHGWIKDTKLKTLQPVPFPVETELAPEFVMRLIRCGCKSATPCRTCVCSCTADGLNCTIFCACYATGCKQA